jgi:hypothetical protein
MSTPVSTATPANFTTNAGYSAMAAEIYTMIFGAAPNGVGLTQTSDTGQMSSAPSLTLPSAINTSSGYWIGRFNDTNQTAAPIFFKLELGSGSGTNEFQLYLTVGTGSNGSGTITGTGAGVMTRVECCGNSTFSSSTTNYISRACYNPTDGVFWFLYKQGSVATIGANGCMGGFSIYRDTNNAGVAQANSVHLLTNSSAAGNGATGNTGNLQVMSFLSATVYNTAPFPTQRWGAFPLGLSSTAFGSNDYGGPIWQFTPIPGISPWGQIQLLSEVPLGTTVSLTIIGSTAHTYIQAGVPFGCNAMTNDTSLIVASYGLLLPWE